MTLRITIEIVPFGDETRKRTLHTIDVSNLGRFPGTNAAHNVYAYRVVCDGQELTDSLMHIRSQGALALAKRACECTEVEYKPSDVDRQQLSDNKE